MRRAQGSRAARKGLELCQRYGESGQTRDLDGGIKLLRAALAQPGAPGELGSVLGNLATALWSRYEDSRDRAALDESIAMHSAAISGDWVGAEDRFYWMQDLARALRVRYDAGRDSADLDTAITLGQASRAVPFRPPADIWTAQLAERASDLEERARLRLAAAEQAATTAALADADLAVALRREIIAAASADDPGHAGLLSSLGAALLMRAGLAEACGHPQDAAADVAEAVQQHRAAAQLASGTDPLASRIMSRLCQALTEHARRAGDRAFLDEAAEAARAGFRQAGPDQAATAAAALVTVLAQRSAGASDPAHLSELIDALQDPAIGPAAVPAAADLRLATGAALVRRYWLTGDLPDLTGAIEHYRGVLFAHGQADGADLAAARSGLSAALRIRYQRTGAAADLTEATALARTALSAAGDAAQRVGCLGDLGRCLVLGGGGEHGGLAEGIEFIRRAISELITVPPGDRVEAAGVSLRADLGLALRSRYEQTRSLADLEEAIELTRAALAAPLRARDPGTHGDDCFRLGVALQFRYRHAGRAADLDEAITHGREAARVLPDRSPGRPVCLSSLNLALRLRYGGSGDAADLDEAVTVGHVALDWVTEGAGSPVGRAIQGRPGSPAAIGTDR